MMHAIWVRNQTMCCMAAHLLQQGYDVGLGCMRHWRTPCMADQAAPCSPGLQAPETPLQAAPAWCRMQGQQPCMLVGMCDRCTYVLRDREACQSTHSRSAGLLAKADMQEMCEVADIVPAQAAAWAAGAPLSCSTGWRAAPHSPGLQAPGTPRQAARACCLPDS